MIIAIPLAEIWRSSSDPIYEHVKINCIYKGQIILVYVKKKFDQVRKPTKNGSRIFVILRKMKIRMIVLF